MRAFFFLLLSACLLAGCAEPQDPQPRLATPADSLLMREGSAEVVKSFLDWYGENHGLLEEVAGKTPTSYMDHLRSSGYLSEEYLGEFKKNMDKGVHRHGVWKPSDQKEDPVLLTGNPALALKAIPACIPAFVTTGGSEETIAVDLAGEKLWFTTKKEDSEWKIAYISRPRETEGEALDGEWEYTGNNNDYTFSVKFESRGEEVRGWICALAEKGNRIDCMIEEDGVSFTGTWDGHLGSLNVVSAYSGNSGKASVEMQEKALIWKLTQAPEGEHFLLGEGTLKRLGSL